MVTALAAACEVLDRPESAPQELADAAGGGFVFAYDADTLAELDQAAGGSER